MFYLFDIDVYLNYTQGGVKIDKNAKVINMHTSKPISGLYCIGEAVGGIHGNSRLSGCASMDCMAFAMIAAKDILKNFI